jgi:acyl-CoA thioesterase
MSQPDPPAADPAVAHQLARRCADVMLASDRASRDAGLRLIEVGPGTASMAMTVTAAMSNGHGTCHGGYVFLLADTAFAVACNSFGELSVAQACDIVYVVPARAGDELLARATLRSGFGRNGIYDVTVTRGLDEVVAEFRGRSRNLGTRLLDDPLAH